MNFNATKSSLSSPFPRSSEKGYFTCSFNINISYIIKLKYPLCIHFIMCPCQVLTFHEILYTIKNNDMTFITETVKCWSLSDLLVNSLFQCQIISGQIIHVTMDPNINICDILEAWQTEWKLKCNTINVLLGVNSNNDGDDDDDDNNTI